MPQWKQKKILSQGPAISSLSSDFVIFVSESHQILLVRFNNYHWQYFCQSTSQNISTMPADPSQKWPFTSKDDYGMICGFCPLAMPSAASQLIIGFHLIYFLVSSGMALIWPLPVTVSLLCWSVMICSTFRSCYAGVPVGFQFKNWEYSSQWFLIT